MMPREPWKTKNEKDWMNSAKAMVLHMTHEERLDLLSYIARIQKQEIQALKNDIEQQTA